MIRICIAVLASALLLAGCASSPAAKPGPASGAVAPADRAAPVPAAPKLAASKLPEVLVRALRDPYRTPVPLDCATLGADIRALDAVLGPDLDVLKPGDRPDDAVGAAMAGAVAGLIPYHGLLRFLSGARQREQRLAMAIAAGNSRRGYLKGLGEARRCPVPAAPLRGEGGHAPKEPAR